MIFEVKDITPEDYIRGEDGVLRIDPQLQYRLHCHFVMSLSKYVQEEGWTLRLLHEKDRHNDFPGVSVFPPGQEGQSVLTGYKIEGGLLEELSEEQEQEPYVGRLFTVITIKQRAVAGPLDFRLPATLMEKADGHFFFGGQAGAYDPDEWARLMMKMVSIHHDHVEAMEAVERKYSHVPSS